MSPAWVDNAVSLQVGIPASFLKAGGLWLEVRSTWVGPGVPPAFVSLCTTHSEWVPLEAQSLEEAKAEAVALACFELSSLVAILLGLPRED